MIYVNEQGVVVKERLHRPKPGKAALQQLGNGLYKRMLNSGFTAREVAAIFRVDHKTVKAAADEATIDTPSLAEWLEANAGNTDK